MVNHHHSSWGSAHPSLCFFPYPPKVYLELVVRAILFKPVQSPLLAYCSIQIWDRKAFMNCHLPARTPTPVTHSLQLQTSPSHVNFLSHRDLQTDNLSYCSASPHPVHTWLHHCWANVFTFRGFSSARWVSGSRTTLRSWPEEHTLKVLFGHFKDPLILWEWNVRNPRDKATWEIDAPTMDSMLYCLKLTGRSPDPALWWHLEAGPLGRNQVARVEPSWIGLVPLCKRSQRACPPAVLLRWEGQLVGSLLPGRKAQGPLQNLAPWSSLQNCEK